MISVRSGGRRRVAAGLAAVAATALAACGTRVSHADVVAGAGGGPVSIGSAAAGAAPGVADTAPVPVVGAPTSAVAQAPGSIAAAPVGSAGPATAGAATAGPGAVPGVAGPAPTTAAGSAATTPRTSGAGAGQSCTKQGSPIVYGQVGTFSGVVGASQGSSQPGLKVWAAATNAAGGIACHPVQVISIDDGGDAGRAQSAVQTLVESDHAVAINAMVPLTFNGIQSYLDGKKVPVVGGDLLDKRWYQDPDFFPSGTTFEGVIYSFLRYAVQVGGHKYSFFYCIEATPCTAAQDLITKQGLAAKAGLQGVGDQPISLAGSNFTQQCSTAKSKGADVVIMGAGATAVTAIGRDCANQGYHPIYITEALAAVNSLAQDPNLSGLILGNVAFPYMSSSTPAEQAFQAAMKKYAPSLDVSGAAAGAWASGELFKKAILGLGQAAYGDITPAMVVQGLHAIKGETLGGLVPGKLDFSGNLPAADRCAFITQIKGGAFVAPIGDQQICEP